MIKSLDDLSTCKGHTSITWNARSLLPKIEEIDRIAINAQPEFIGICETWLKPVIEDPSVEIAGYNMLRYDRNENSGKTSGGGLLMYYKSQLRCQPMTN